MVRNILLSLVDIRSYVHVSSKLCILVVVSDVLTITLSSLDGLLEEDAIAMVRRIRICISLGWCNDVI